jgi:uncharacterized membrane protein YkvA (DUF1232 family)
MSWRLWTLTLLGGLALVWIVAVVLLFLAGRRSRARALVGFIPDCALLVGRLLRDPRVPHRRKLLLALTAGYLALPFDLVPDFIPLVGQLDDAIVLALALRGLLRGGGESLLREHWPGPESSLELLLRLVGGREIPRDRVPSDS